MLHATHFEKHWLRTIVEPLTKSNTKKMLGQLIGEFRKIRGRLFLKARIEKRSGYSGGW